MFGFTLDLIKPPLVSSSSSLAFSLHQGRTHSILYTTQYLYGSMSAAPCSMFQYQPIG